MEQKAEFFQKMASNSLLLVAVVSLFGLSSGEWCDDYEDNINATYCLDDYSGYHTCTWKGGSEGGYGDDRADSFVDCPPNTRCSCHFRWPCAHADPSKICVPYTTPKPVVDPAIFTYTGERTYMYLDRVKPRSGEIRQDRANNKYIRVCTHCKKRSFSLALPRASSGWDIFHGNYDDKRCRSYFRPSNDNRFVGDDFHRYTLQKSWDVNGTRQESWYYIKGDEEGMHDENFWEVSVVNGGDNSQPEKSIVTMIYTNRKYNSKETLEWKTTPLGDGESTDEWFTKPDFC